MPSVTPRPGRIAVGGAIQTFLALSLVKLFKTNVTVNNETVVGDLTEADFTGYTAQTATVVGAPFYNPLTGGVTIPVPSHVFATASPYTVGNTIYGWWLEDAGGELIAAGNFDNPIDMTGASQAIPLEVFLNF